MCMYACKVCICIEINLSGENIEFWYKNDWPPNSPDLNPLDYEIWGILEADVYRKPTKSLEALTRRIQQTWDFLQMTIVNNCIDSFKKRLRKCVDAKGACFE